MYHGPAENDYTHKKNVTDFYPKLWRKHYGMKRHSMNRTAFSLW